MTVQQWKTVAADNNSSPPTGAPEGMAAAAVNNTMREMMASVAIEAQVNRVKVLGTVAGTNTITGVLTPALTAYSAGMLLVFTPAVTNTGATTLNIDALGALDIQKADGDALVAGDLIAGIPAFLVLDSGADDWILLNPQSANLSNGVAISDLARLSQANVFLAGQRVSTATPFYELLATGAAVDNKKWFNYVSGTSLNLSAATDAEAHTNWMTVSRTGATVDSINLQATAVQVNGSTITGPVSSGTWTPTVTNGTNLTGTPTVSAGQYIRVGNVVNASVNFIVTSSGANAATTCRVSLPVASDISAGREAVGTAVARGNTDNNVAAIVFGNSVNNDVDVTFPVTTGELKSILLTFTYLVT